MNKPLPKFSNQLPVFEPGSEEVFALGVSGSIPVGNITPVLNERMFPEMWAPGINRATQQSHGLVIAMPIWERAGTVMYDLSGNGNNATIVP